MKHLPYPKTVLPRRIVTAISLLALIITAFVLPRQVLGQDAKVLTYDTPVTGQITDAAVQDSWTLTVPAKDRLSLTVDRVDGTLVPKVELYDSDKKLIANADNDNTFARATIKTFKLPAPGNYTVVVGRYKDKDGKTSGNYTLTAALLGAGLERPEIYKLIFKPIHDGPVQGTITNAQWIESWRLNSHTSGHILIEATRIDGNLIPTLAIFGPNNQEIQRVAAEPEGDRAVLDVTLANTSEYEIRVARTGNEDGTTTGKYGLTVTELGIGTDDASLSIIEGLLKIDTPKKGMLINARWADRWGINLTEASSLTITATRTSGTLIPLIKVMDMTGKELITGTADETFTTAVISNYAFPAPGQYLIMIQRADGTAGGTEGGYELTVTQGQK
ncbi:MAG: PPC domain-containing protein [Chloroflexota bacterium]